MIHVVIHERQPLGTRSLDLLHCHCSKTSESFSCRIRSVCFVPHFLTTERKQVHSGYEVARKRCLFQLLFHLPQNEISLRCMKQIQEKYLFSLSIINFQNIRKETDLNDPPKITSERNKNMADQSLSILLKNVVHLNFMMQ